MHITQELLKRCFWGSEKIFGFNMSSSKKIIKEITFNFLVIKLYGTEKKIGAENESIGNIQAFNLQGDLVWIVEPPTFNFSYFNMQIDETTGMLEADSGAGRVYKINLDNGHIINSEIIK